MQWTGLNELREKFLSFMESKGCLRLPSFPLIPKDDNSLLLINSGMAPMKKYFTGEVTPPRKRVTTCQKCIRTPDIEEVGITDRHGTYFEMLGNFSFGDYFKREATAWAWEFFTEVLEIPKEKLYVSVYQEDDEAFDIWTKEVGVEESHMVRLGKADNFWEHGSGPCGPCSEIYYDRGENHGCGSPDCKVGCECDRFMEVWNLVFTQFDNDGNNNYTPLANPNIDTGMGLERLACVMQGVDNLFLVDTVQNTMKHISSIVGVNYGEDDKKDISLRVITDHIRSTTFMIGDGVMPSNEGRGYVLRRLLRRAARHGRILGYNKPFLFEVADTVIKDNEGAYPELRDKRDFIVKLIEVEEENFGKTIDQGLQLLEELIVKAESKILSGDDAFKLNDTFGFPIDLIKEIVGEKGMSVDIDRFTSLLKEQKKRSRDARKNAGADAWISESTDLTDICKTEFTGYKYTMSEAKVAAIVKDGQRVETLLEGENGIVILDKTPFYAESGGQVGDTGMIVNDNIALVVNDTTKDPSGIFLHSVSVDKGMLQIGDVVEAEIDSNKRMNITRNHTAAHLLQAALRELLGTHVEQAGQLVSDDYFRFDFTHFEALTADEISKVEAIVNEKIFAQLDVISEEMGIDEAKKMGAMMLFGEKYGDRVRVVNAGDFSIEFCGGTHVKNTSHIGLFKIKSESSVASGVRRIEAVTGQGVLNYLDSALYVVNRCTDALKINNPKELVQGAIRIAEELKAKEKKIDELNKKLAQNATQDLFKNAQRYKGVRIISVAINDAPTDTLRDICSRATDNKPMTVIVLAGISGDKVTFICGCGKDAIAHGLKAGNIVKQVAQIAGGNGGGKPNMAMAGAKDVSKVDDAIIGAESIIKSMIDELGIE
ncbi:MAG: alanine--tRNA ligase [Oscillospiraceae bacterium]|nr:alanine--tRNA ligase [Oscillospiraceae bacterium]